MKCGQLGKAPAWVSLILAVSAAMSFSQARGDSGPGGSPETAPAALGLEAVLRRAIGDSWTLANYKLYETNDPAFWRRIALAMQKAQQLRQGSQVEVPVDSDGDGLPDLWVYFSQDKPAFVEGDLFQTGCHDLRIVPGEGEAQIREPNRWFLDAPVPIAPPAHTPLGPAEFYDRAVLTAGESKSASLVSQWAHQLLPRLDIELEALAKTSKNERQPDLSRYEALALSLLPGLERTFQEKKLAEKLQFPGGWRLHFEMAQGEDRSQPKVMVGYAPWGVVRVRFFSPERGDDGNFFDDRGLLADCFLEKGLVVRIDLGGDRYFRLGRYWARLRHEVRAQIAQRCLYPGLIHFRQSAWYEAIQLWRQGLLLAGLTGDFAIGKNGLPEGMFKDREIAAWGKPVAGWQASSLLRTAYSFVTKSSKPEGVKELAAQAAEAKNYPEALALLNLEVRLNKKAGCTTGQVNALEATSHLYTRLGNVDLAFQCLLQSLDLEASLGYARDLVENLPYLIENSSSEGTLGGRKVESAMEMRSHALAVNRACKLARLASLYGYLEEWDKARRDLDEAERLFRKLGHVYGQADVLNLRAEWDLVEGRPERAQERLEAALKLVQAQPSSPETSDEARQGPTAEKHPLHVFQFPEGPFQKYAVFLRTRAHPRSYEALTLGLLGEAYLQQAHLFPNDPGQRDRLLKQAVSCQEQAGQWYRKAGDSEGELTTRLRLANLAFSRKDWPKALELARQVAEESQRNQVFEHRWQSLTLQGKTQGAMGNQGEALHAYGAAAAEIESVRGRIHSELARRGFLGSKMTVYEEMARLHAARGSNTEAWECMERSKARTLLDLISGQPLPVKGREVVQLSSTAPPVFHYLRGTNQPGPLRADQAERELAQSLNRLANQPEMQELLSLKNVQPLDLKSIQQVLGKTTLLIEYLPTEEELLASVIAPGSMEIVHFPAYGRGALGRAVAALRARFQDPHSHYQDLAQKLFHDLLAPCLARHPSCEHLVIVPGGALHYLPFHALLSDRKEFVIQRRQVSYAPSATALVYSLRKGGPWATQPLSHPLIVGQSQVLPMFPELPPLPGVAREIKEINKRLAKSQVCLNEKETKIKTALPEADLFHFAGHAELVPNAPMRSALFCADSIQDDGRLEVRELFGMDLSKCRLAVLSACRTQLGDWNRGDEIVGLGRAFLRAGVPSVVASLWNVRDDPTSRIMIRFYECLSKPGTSRLAALTQAQREYLANQLRELESERPPDVLVGRGKVVIAKPDPLAKDSSPPFPAPDNHPFYWAAFELIGDWR